MYNTEVQIWDWDSIFYSLFDLFLFLYYFHWQYLEIEEYVTKILKMIFLFTFKNSVLMTPTYYQWLNCLKEQVVKVLETREWNWKHSVRFWFSLFPITAHLYDASLKICNKLQDTDLKKTWWNFENCLRILKGSCEAWEIS